MGGRSRPLVSTLLKNSNFMLSLLMSRQCDLPPMNRFLTPSKISLLALIELYTDSIIPNSSNIPILSFILDQVLHCSSKIQSHESIPLWQSFSQSLPFVLNLESFELLLKHHTSCSSIQDTSPWDFFLKKLWDIDSLDALHMFFMKQTNLLVKSHDELKKEKEMGITSPTDKIIVSRTSPFGSFIRKSCIEFERLKFSDSVELWTAFANWRRPSKTYWETRISELEKWAGDASLSIAPECWGTTIMEKLENVVIESVESLKFAINYISSDDIEKILEFQVEKMQRFGNRIPSEVMVELRNTLNQNMLIPSLSHYLNFLESWRSGNYTSSFDSLHRYFDYTIQNRDRLFYQYALMNLAILQADFCCFDEAVAAMIETISTARENKDMACLNFALNWLYHFGKVHPKIITGTISSDMLGAERQGLSFLRNKAKEAEMWTLWSSSLLSEGKLGMANGENLAIILENILKSSHLIVEKNLKSMIGPQMAMHSSLWGRLGVFQLFKQHCEIFLIYHAQHSVFDDVLCFTNRMANLLVEQGQYDKALDILENLDPNSLRSWKANHYWLKCKQIVRLKRTLLNGDLDNAARFLNQLLHDKEDKDNELSFEIIFLHIDYLIRRTDYSQALLRIEDILSSMREDGDDINLKIRLLVLKARLYDKAGRPQKGFSIALRAASTAWRARLLPTLWAAMAAITNILTSLSEFQVSVQILVAIFPRALECRDYKLNAILYSLLGDAYMGLAGQAKAESSERKKSITQSFKFIERALGEYSKLEDHAGQCEMIAKMATIMKVMGETKFAEEYARAYSNLKKEVIF